MARVVGAKDKKKRAKGSGRKPKAFTLLKKRIETEQTADADYAFALYAAVMRDGAQAISLRLECADWIANRVLGKPKEKLEHSGEIALKGYSILANPDDWDEPDVSDSDPTNV